MESGPARTRWEEMYSKVLLFVQSKKHARIPCSTPELKKMNQWWHAQLRRKKYGHDQLEKINIIHGWIDTKELGKKTQGGAAWDRMFLLLQKQKKENGSLFAHNKMDKVLFNWVTEQRRLATQSKLDPARKEKLLDLGLALSVYNFKIQYENQPRWIRTGLGGDHMALVGCTPKARVQKKTILETTGKRTVSHVLIKWTSNEVMEWVCSNQVGDPVVLKYGRGKKRSVTSPKAADERRRKVHANETTIYQSRSKFKARAKLNPADAVDRYMTQLREKGISEMPLNSISFFIEYVSSLSLDTPQVLFEVLTNFYSSVVP